MFQENFIHALESFNAKERFFVMRQVYGKKFIGEPSISFAPSQDFLDALGSALSIKLPIRNLFAAMDYHLNWLYASLCLCQQAQSNELDIAECAENGMPIGRSTDGIVLQNQEDIDFLIAFDLPGDSQLHVALIEAKATTPWTYGQLESKIKRFRLLSESGDAKDAWANIRWHVVLFAPKRLNQGLAQKLQGISDAYNWSDLYRMLVETFKGPPAFMHLQVGYNKDIFSVGLSDEKSRSMANGEYWAIARRRSAKLLVD